MDVNKFKFEELHVYQESLNLTDSIYTITKTWPKDEQFGLTNQIRRSASSIALNIAEGSSRTKKDFKHFLNLSRGSCFESVAILSIANKRGYIDETIFRKHYNWIDKISRMLSKLKSSIIVP